MKRQAKRQALLREQIKAASKPMNVAAYDLKTRDIYVGKSEPLMDDRGGSAVTIEGLNSNTRCSGRTDTQDAGKGSIHTATLLCRDGRIVKTVFTHETLRSGYGTGSDQFGNTYQFVFGDLELNIDELRRKFEAARTEKKWPS
jgi:hypothetical protein